MPNANEPGVPKGSKPKGYRSAYNRLTRKDPVRWGDVDAVTILDALDACQSAGDALLLGATRDGGALVITVCSGDERFKYYPTSILEAETTLVDITKSAKSLAGIA
jgi:hypothetical protein